MPGSTPPVPLDRLVQQLVRAYGYDALRDEVERQRPVRVAFAVAATWSRARRRWTYRARVRSVGTDAASGQPEFRGRTEDEALLRAKVYARERFPDAEFGPRPEVHRDA